MWVGCRNQGTTPTRSMLPLVDVPQCDGVAYKVAPEGEEHRVVLVHGGLKVER